MNNLITPKKIVEITNFSYLDALAFLKTGGFKTVEQFGTSYTVQVDEFVKICKERNIHINKAKLEKIGK